VRWEAIDRHYTDAQQMRAGLSNMMLASACVKQPMVGADLDLLKMAPLPDDKP
jgi:hypothetical protein